MTEIIAGVDEAGRGPLAGPVVAAAVIFEPHVLDDEMFAKLRDSKKLSVKQREHHFTLICQKASAFAIAEVSAIEIDRINILQATMQAMRNAISDLKIQPTLILVDGNQTPLADTQKTRVKAIIDGDATEKIIAAASVLAKVWRDRIMAVLGNQFPEYGFAVHKGYPTKAHILALKAYGPLHGIHRFSFQPVKTAAITGEKV